MFPVQGVFAPGCASSAQACGWGNLAHGVEPCEPVKAGAHRGRGGCVHVELSGGDAGGTANREGHPQPFLRKSLETADVREGPQDEVRTDDGTGAPQWRVPERRSRFAH